MAEILDVLTKLSLIIILINISIIVPLGTYYMVKDLFEK